MPTRLTSAGATATEADTPALSFATDSTFDAAFTAAAAEKYCPPKFVAMQKDWTEGADFETSVVTDAPEAGAAETRDTERAMMAPRMTAQQRSAVSVFARRVVAEAGGGGVPLEPCHLLGEPGGPTASPGPASSVQHGVSVTSTAFARGEGAPVGERSWRTGARPTFDRGEREGLSPAP